MAKGEDAVIRKRNKKNRKRMRSGDTVVSTRVAAIIAAKRRRKTGGRRICEGMCFSLPTPDDPFNDRRGKKENPVKSKKQPQQKPKRPDGGQQKPKRPAPDADGEREQFGGKEAAPSKLGDCTGCPSKFLVLCLNAIQGTRDEEGTPSDARAHQPLSVSTWGLEFWMCCSAGSNVVDTSGACADREQLAWLLSAASDIITTKEKQGLVVASPFLLFLVPSQEKALQVRSVCKPLKALGIHTVSLHPGASLDHQIRGLKSCEPEFLISTPERLLELVSLRAVDISGVSMLVLDGLKSFVDLGFQDKVKSICGNISGDPQMVIFSDCCGEVYTSMVQNLLRGSVNRISLYDSIACQSAFVSQYVHFYTSEEEKISEAVRIIFEARCHQNPQCSMVLLIARTANKGQLLVSFLKNQGYVISSHSHSDCLTIAKGRRMAKVFVKDGESVRREDIENFEIVMFVDFPSSIEDYIEILRRIARHSVSGVLHSFFCKADSPLAQPLIKVLEQCGQMVPEILRSFDSS